MWIMTNKGFISAVQDRGNGNRVVIRARVKKHLQDLLKPLCPEIIESPNGDYLYRVYVHKSEFADLLREWAMNIDYENFKDSVPKKNKTLYDAYNAVWGIMLRLQPWKARKKVPQRFMNT